MTSKHPKPFEIKVSDDFLRETREKLEAARLPDELQNTGWEDGTPTSEIRKLRDFPAPFLRLESGTDKDQRRNTPVYFQRPCNWVGRNKSAFRS
jgi:hypothetical protein